MKELTRDRVVSLICEGCLLPRAPVSLIAPGLAEARAHCDRPGIREWVQTIDRDLDESAAQKLRIPEQLPEISAESFTLVWDFEAGKELARYEQ